MIETPRRAPEGACTSDEAESGMIMIVLLASVLPLVLLVGAAATTMTTRNKGLLYDIRQTKALLAAEAGIDAAIFRSANGTLNHQAPFSRTFSNGYSYTVKPVHLLVDGFDNDNDGIIDEFDENIFELIVTGSFGNSKRRLAAYLGPLGDLPQIDGAVTLTHPNVIIDFKMRKGFDPLLTGKNTNMDGTPGLAALDTAGLVIESPGTIANLLTKINAYAAPLIQGVGVAPSLASVSNGYDFNAIMQQAQNTANIVLTTMTYRNVDWGNAETDDYNIIFRDGRLEVFGGRGAGILVVTGEIELEDGFRWDGLIISTHGHELELESDANKGLVQVFGAMVVGPTCKELEMEGDVAMYYCQEVLEKLHLLVPSSRYIGFNGWQEISLYESTEEVYVPPVIGMGTVVTPPVVFGSGAVIGTTCNIKENSTFGDNLNIGNSVDVLAGCSVGDNVQIGNSSLIKESVVIGDNAVIGNNVQVGVGATITAGANVPNNAVIPDGATY